MAGEDVPPTAIVPYAHEGVVIETLGSVLVSVPFTPGAVLPPLSRTEIFRSTVSPASTIPSAFPEVPPIESSSTTGTPALRVGGLGAVSVTVAWYGTQSNPATVSLKVPTLSGRKSSVALPAPSVVATR